jgi:hypothetical protein
MALQVAGERGRVGPGHVPRVGLLLILLYPGEVLGELVELGNGAVRDAGRLRPVTAIEEAVVGPLGEVVLGDEIDHPVRQLAHLPVVSGGNALPGLGGIGLEHLLVEAEEGALLGVLIAEQPVRCGGDQVDLGVAGQQLDVVLGLPIRPLDIEDVERCVGLLGEQRVEFREHLLQPTIGRFVAESEHGDLGGRGVGIIFRG